MDKLYSQATDTNLSEINTAAEQAAASHKQGCDALGGYGHGIGPCSCGAEQAAAEGEAITDEDAALHLQEWIKQGKLPQGVVPFVEMAIEALARRPVRELTDDQIQELWGIACQDTPSAPAWSRHIRFARALLSKATGEGKL